MKKVLSMLLILVMVLTMATGCGNSGSKENEPDKSAVEDEVAKDDASELEATDDDTTEGTTSEASDVKVGVIYIGDENEGYTESHMKGIQEMKTALGLSDDQIIEKTLIPEDESCYDAAVDLADQGCTVIFANSFGHESYMLQAAAEFPDVQFCHATGFQAAGSGLDNVHNYFTAIYEARYVSGVVAGMKLKEMIDNGDVKEEEALVGYVGAYPYAEVISGYTSFFLGVRSICPTATMEVRFTNSWASIDLEKECAEALIADGCKLISQHADTTGASSACEANGIPIVGYNVSMIATAPTQALTSASNNWAPYYTYAVKCVMDGTKMDVDWCRGFEEGSVKITELNEAAVVAGTAEKVAEVEAAIMDGSLKVFDTSTWTVDGETLDSWTDDFGNEYISDGYFHESELASAPSFSLSIDGIKSITQ